jgi:hypothetical protein
MIKFCSHEVTENIQTLREVRFIATNPITNPQILIWKKTEINAIYSYITARLLVSSVEENCNLQEKIREISMKNIPDCISLLLLALFLTDQRNLYGQFLQQ